MLLTASCATAKLPKVITYDEAAKEVATKQWVVTKVEDEKDFKPGSSEVVPKSSVLTMRVKQPDGTYKEVKKTLTSSQIMIDRNRAAYYARLKSRRDRFRGELKAERKNNYINTRIHETTTENLKVRAKQQSTWWEQNKGLIGLAFGTLIGMAITVGLVYALNKGNGVNSSSNVHVLNKGFRF